MPLILVSGLQSTVSILGMLEIKILMKSVKLHMWTTQAPKFAYVQTLLAHVSTIHDLFHYLIFSIFEDKQNF